MLLSLLQVMRGQRKMTGKRIIKRSSMRNSGKGYTLVEMIVVLVVLAILAAGGIFSAIGYVKKSTFDQNQSNAEAIYHAVQSGLQQMEKSGKISKWVADNISKQAYAFPYTSANPSSNTKLEETYVWKTYNEFNVATAKPNSSVHMRFVLTYNPNEHSTAESKTVKGLVQPYFYDATIFQGTVTIEFDVEKSVDAYKTEHYSAKCLSVFYSSRAKNGWGSIPDAYEGSETTVPTRDYTHRRNKSHIGYCEGYKGTSVDTVYLPELQEGIKIKKLAVDFTSEPEGEGEAAVEKTHIWLTWAATNDKENLIGTQKDVYYRFALYNGSNFEKTLILNEDFLKDGDTAGGSRKSVDFSGLATAGSTYQGATVETETYPVAYSDTVSHDITKKSITIDAQVYVKETGNDGYDGAEDSTINNRLQKVKLKISYVSNEYDSTGTNLKNPYFEYSIDITPFMSADTDKAQLKIYPNYFSNSFMSKVNDNDGIIPFKKGKSVTIETEPEEPEP